MSRRHGIALAVALFAVGALAELALEGPVPRAITVVCLFAFLVVGLVTVASPEFLSDDADESEEPPPGEGPTRTG